VLSFNLAHSIWK